MTALLKEDFISLGMQQHTNKWFKAYNLYIQNEPCIFISSDGYIILNFKDNPLIKTDSICTNKEELKVALQMCGVKKFSTDIKSKITRYALKELGFGNHKVYYSLIIREDDQSKIALHVHIYSDKYVGTYMESTCLDISSISIQMPNIKTISQLKTFIKLLSNDYN